MFKELFVVIYKVKNLFLWRFFLFAENYIIQIKKVTLYAKLNSHEHTGKF